MAARKKLVRKDVIRLARQKLWTDIGKALDSYEKHVYGDRALGSKQKLTTKESFEEVYYGGKKLTADEWQEILDAVPDVKKIQDEETETREGDISTVEEIEKILPPEPTRSRSRARKPSPVSEHIRGEEASPQLLSDPVHTLFASAEKVLILIVQSAGGMTPAQIAIKVALKKRTIQNILTSLKSQRFIIKDANHGKFRITEEGREAVRGRFMELEKGAILVELSESERKVLFAIASKKEGITLSAISVMVPGIKKRTKQNIVTALKTRELIEKQGDYFALTEHAREELKGKLEKPLTGKALREKLLESLPEPQAAVLDWLSYDGGRTATAEELANSLGYATRTVQNIFTALKAQEFITKYDGRFQLSSHLKD
jgi:predicted transcriptional regulator